MGDPRCFQPQPLLGLGGQIPQKRRLSAIFSRFASFIFSFLPFANIHQGVTLVIDLPTAGFLQASACALGRTWPKWSCSFSSPPSCSVLKSLLFLDKCPVWRASWVSPTLLSCSEWWLYHVKFPVWASGLLADLGKGCCLYLKHWATKYDTVWIQMSYISFSIHWN